MVKFRKATNCPASEKLLAFQNGEVSVREKDKITIHVRFCEFCAAEVEFYAHYPQSDEMVTGEEIPLPLLELAQALLNNKREDFNLLNGLIDENR